MPFSRTVIVAAWLAAGCSRGAKHDEERATAPQSGSAQTTATPEPGAASPSAPAPEPVATNAKAPEPEPVALGSVTAEALLAEVRRAGGKGTLVNAWASWCGPCRREIPMLQNLAPNLRAQSIGVLLVSLDEPEDREKARAFLENQRVTLPSLLAARPLGAFKLGLNPRWPGMLPASFLFDAAGRLRYFWGGEAFEEELVPVLEAFAAGRPIEGQATPEVAPEQPTP